MEYKDGSFQPPYSDSLKKDASLETVWHDITEKYVPLSRRKNNSELLFDVAPEPSLLTLAKLSNLAYFSWTEISTPELPQGWTRLARAQSFKKGNGYYGVVFRNLETRQIVIAHRGTYSLDALRTDWDGVYKNEFVPQMSSACTFAFQVYSTMKDTNVNPGDAFDITLTGHSLGGWLAQVTAFFLKYLTIRGEDILRLEDLSRGYHAAAVVFDSPGCKAMLNKMEDAFQPRYGGHVAMRKNLNVASYLSSPNLVNCCNLHVGRIYRLFTTIGSEAPLWYTAESHSITGIISALESHQEILEVVDWPDISPAYRDGTFFQSVISRLFDGKDFKDYNDFFKWASRVNSYHPNIREAKYYREIKRKKLYCPIRYQTKSFNEKQTVVHVFSEFELQFLQSWQWLRKLPDGFKVGSSSFFEAVGKDEQCHRRIENTLNLLEIKKESVTSTSKEELNRAVAFVKRLLRLFPSLKEKVRKEINIGNVKKRVYESETDNYLINVGGVSSVLKENNIFDTISFLQRLEEHPIWHLRVDDHTDVYTAALHMTLAESDIGSSYKNFFTMSLSNLLKINKIIPLRDIFVSDDSSRTLLLLDCDVLFDSEQLTLLLDNESKFQDTNTIVLISPEYDNSSETMARLNEMFDSKYFTRKLNLITFEKLSVDSRKDILSRKLITYQGAKPVISLHKLFENINLELDVSNLNAILDHQTLVSLMKNVPISLGGKICSKDKALQYFVSRSFERESSKDDDRYLDLASFVEKLDRHKRVIISDTSGTGKSTLIRKLALEIKDKHPNMWVVTVPLNKCTEILEIKRKGKDENYFVDQEDAIEFFTSEITNVCKHTKMTIFERKVFRSLLLRNGGTVILFDSFDEITPLYEALTLELLGHLNRTRVQNIIVASRPHSVTGLEAALDTRSWKLRPFTSEDQEEFLVKYWQSEDKEGGRDDVNGRTLSYQDGREDKDGGRDDVDGRPSTDDNQDGQQGRTCGSNLQALKTKAAEAIALLSAAVGGKRMELGGVPLVCRLLGDVYKDGNLPSEEFTLNRLYHLFITRNVSKRLLNLNKPDNVSLALVNFAITRYHWLLSLRLLLGDGLASKLELDSFDENENLQEAALSVGIVEKINPPIFVNRTFAEYFIAEFFAEQLPRQYRCRSMEHVLLTEILLKREFRVVRSFFDGHLRDTVLSKKTLKSCGEGIVEDWLKRKQTFFYSYYSALHVAVLERADHIFRFLVDCCLTSSADVLIWLVATQYGHKKSVLNELVKIENEELIRYTLDRLQSCSVYVQRIALMENVFKDNYAASNQSVKYFQSILQDYPGLKAAVDDIRLARRFLEDAKNGNVDSLRESLRVKKDTKRFLLSNFEDYAAVAQGLDSNSWAIKNAVENGHASTVQLLIENGALHGTTVVSPLLRSAIKAGEVEVFRLLAESQKESRSLLNDWELFQSAISSETYDILPYLYRFGFNVNSTNIHGESPLHYATKKGDLEAIQSLLRHEANLNITDSFNRTALHYAVTSNNRDVVKYLLDNRAKVNMSDANGNTPLHEAVNKRASPAMVQLLLSFDADKEAKNNDGRTALDIATRNHQPLLVVALYEIEKRMHGFNNCKKAVEFCWRVALSHLQVLDEPNSTVIPNEFLENLGDQFIRKNNDGEIEFVHSEINAYFASDYIENCLTTLECTMANWDIVLGDVLLKEECKDTCQFLNRRLKRLTFDAKSLKFIGETFLELWSRNSGEESYESTTLHLAVIEKNVHLLDFLLKVCFNAETSMDKAVRFVTSGDSTGRSALCISASSNMDDCTEVFCQNCKLIPEQMRMVIFEKSFLRDSGAANYLLEKARAYEHLNGVCREISSFLTKQIRTLKQNISQPKV